MNPMSSQGDPRALGVTTGVEGGIAKMGSFSLARQTSIYSLTLEEFRNSLGEPGKNFGSMNMDEFLKNIWTAEESQAMAAAMGAALDGTVGGGGGLAREASLQRQGSLTLPRTLSRKTVDEVWKDIFKENTDVNGNCCQNAQRQATFGEMTLEDFLVKAGVVREEPEPYGGRFGNGQFPGFSGNSMERNEEGMGINNSLALGFSDRGGAGNREVRNKGGAGAPGMASLTLSPASNALSNQAALDVINLEALKASQQQQQTDWLNNQYRTAIAQQQQQHHHHQLLQQHQQQQHVADPAAAVYASVKRQGNGALMGSALGGPLGLSPTGIGNGLQGGLGVGLAGLGATALTIGAGSPANQLSSDGVGTSHGENSTVSSMQYGLNGDLRGRKRGGPVEKVIERRQRRMIKNRESAARSRARKQAYTVELEAEVTQLKEENRELRRKQEEMAERRKKQMLETMAPLSQQFGSKTRKLRRTQTGPW
uniref:BZIP domain-containing protein n=1 Tax=Araucaria cunninghamii TaxID=56994 RepID=A0A0D6QWI0_ARACU